MGKRYGLVLDSAKIGVFAWLPFRLVRAKKELGFFQTVR